MTEHERQSAAAGNDLAGALAAVIEGDVMTDDYTKHLYASDASMYEIEPLAVVLPKHSGDVAAVMTVAIEHGIPVLPRGAGTSLAGQTVSRAIVLDFSRYMNQIVSIDAEAKTAVVQPGVIQDQLNQAVAGMGLMFGPDTSTSNRATIGGMIGNNSAGSHSIRYGSTIDHVESLQVVFSDASQATLAPTASVDADHPPQEPSFHARLLRGVGELLRDRSELLAEFPPFWRHSGGYRVDQVLSGDELNLHKLVVGSEGTLALVVEATVRLVDRPRSHTIAVGHFHTVASAIAATSDALALSPASVELIDGTILDLARERTAYADLKDHLAGDPRALLFVEFSGDDPAVLAKQVASLAERWADGGHGYHTLQAVDSARQEAVLKVRKASLGLLMAASTGTRRPLAFVEDTAVPPEVLPQYVDEFAAVLRRHGMNAGFYGHCSVGCLHIRPFVDLSVPHEITAMREVSEEIATLVQRYKGVNSSEHGDGFARSYLNQRLFGEPRYDLMRSIKHLFDPRGLLNPGKVVDAPDMTENLRDAKVRTPPAEPLTTRLSFRAAGDMRAAADRCMNIGVCRKEGAGVMCPSYMATRDEADSTRGRANALVKALSENVPRTALGDERLHEILDLCVECKACKSECPLGVDMATLKSEALYQYQQNHGTPLRARTFGNIRALNRLGSIAAPLSNWTLRRTAVRAVMERILGISRQRDLPTFSRRTVLNRRRRATSRQDGDHPRGDIVLLTDSFTTYCEPEITRAAVELLELAGWRVRLTGSSLCCGRAGLSKGLLPKTQRMAAAMIDQLSPFAERGVPIVGIEPSCILTIKDDYGALLADDPRVKTVADHTLLIQDVLLRAIDEGSLVLRDDSTPRDKRVVFHGHCHEKAVVGTKASRQLLERVPGVQVEEIDAGCCGMAGSFGYEAEHYDVSLRMGGLRLFPTLRAEPAATVVVATGTSCRAQIAHGAERKAIHPIELIRDAVVTPAARR